MMTNPHPLLTKYGIDPDNGNTALPDLTLPEDSTPQDRAEDAAWALRHAAKLIEDLTDETGRVPVTDVRLLLEAHLLISLGKRLFPLVNAWVVVSDDGSLRPKRAWSAHLTQAAATAAMTERSNQTRRSQRLRYWVEQAPAALFLVRPS